MPAGSHFLIEEGMLADTIKTAELNGERFYSIGVKNQLLHAAHPLGWFREIKLVVDGKTIPKEDVFFEIRGQWINCAWMHTVTDIFWYIMEEARLNFRLKPDIGKGAHRIACEFTVSTLEVATQRDLARKWPGRKQTVEQTAVLY